MIKPTRRCGTRIVATVVCEDTLALASFVIVIIAACFFVSVEGDAFEDANASSFAFASVSENGVAFDSPTFGSPNGLDASSAANPIGGSIARVATRSRSRRRRAVCALVRSRRCVEVSTSRAIIAAAFAVAVSEPSKWTRRRRSASTAGLRVFVFFFLFRTSASSSSSVSSSPLEDGGTSKMVIPAPGISPGSRATWIAAPEWCWKYAACAPPRPSTRPTLCSGTSTNRCARLGSYASADTAAFGIPGDSESIFLRVSVALGLSIGSIVTP